MMNDDMDDMMRKAADDYELNHEMASDWNKVLAGVQQPEQTFVVKPQEKKRRKFLLWLWFLIIPAMLFTAYKINLFTISSFNRKAAVEIKSGSDIEIKKSNNDVKQVNSSNTINNNSTAVQKQVHIKNNYITNNERSVLSQRLLSSSINKSTPVINNFSNAVDAAINNNDKQALANSNQNNSVQESTNMAATGLINQSQTAILNKDLITDTLVIKQKISGKNDSISASKNINKDSPVVISSTKKNKTNNYLRQAFAYAGIMTNADVSFIKNQKISSPSLGVGIVGGYHFKNGISVESGLLYERKNYYTKGKYFNTDKLSYLQNVKLLATNGNCYMYEIPLSIAYDFKSHKKYNWFVTAGASSYLMHKEYYNFKYDYNGSYGEKGYDYYHSSKNWFSILNFGAGVNVQTSNKYFIKVQPYYKAPLSGVGIGKLRLSSAGINISLTRRIP